MLTNLCIKNFITIKDFESEFFNGLSVFTGESGAGKSVIFTALYCLLGNPFPVDLIRPNNEFSELEATFDISFLNNPALNDLTDNEPTLIIYRKCFKSKRSIIKINSQSVTQKKLKEISTFLAIFINQHEQLALLKPSYQLELIDKLDDSILKEKENYTQSYKSYLDKKREIESFSTTTSSSQQLDFYKYQLNDISDHQFEAEEEFELKNKKKDITLYLQASKDLMLLCDGLDQGLNQFTHLNQLVNKLEIISDDIKSSFDNVVESIADLSFKLSGYNKQTSSYDISLEDIEKRLDLIFTYCTKYKVLNINQLCDLEKELVKKIDLIENSEQKIKELKNQLQTIESALHNSAEKLTMLRKSQTTVIEKELQTTLNRLGFSDLIFEIQFKKNDQFSASGHDHIQFMVKINKGTELKPIHESASGGELSRILLAFYSVFSKTKEKKLFLFDEIDTGVGGLSANNIGAELKNISYDQQVFCITHLAQIANMANNHLVVSKITTTNETYTTVNYLNKDDNLELVRMMGGKTFLKEVNKS